MRMTAITAVTVIPIIPETAILFLVHNLVTVVHIICYHFSMDLSLRQIERAVNSGDSVAKEQLIRVLHRAGNHPYWIRVRELTSEKDNIYYDQTLKEQQPHLPRWEQRGPSLDREWVFFLHIPMADGTQMVVWLGEISCKEPSEELSPMVGTIGSVGDRYLWDKWLQRENNNNAEIIRANWAVAAALKSPARAPVASHDSPTFTGGGNSRVHFFTGLPVNWTPRERIDFSRIQLAPESGVRDVITQLSDENPYTFLVEDYLFKSFYGWLQNTQTEYGSRLRQACFPLNYQLPTVYQDKHIWLHYWKEWDQAREIIEEPGAYYPNRTVYDVSYCVSWCGDYSSRFYRWGGEPGDDNSGGHINALSASRVVYEDRPEIEHIEAQQEAREAAYKAVQKKLQAMLTIANFWNYQVFLEEVSLPYKREKQVRGCPCGVDPYQSTWMAGMQVPEEIRLQNQSPGGSTFSWCKPI